MDEINRLPETRQSMILNGVDRGNWEYLNDAVINREYCLFATANYQDRGTNTIIAPLMDRFDVMVESRHPDANHAGFLGANGTHEMALRHEPLEKEFQNVLGLSIPYETRMEKLDALSDQFGDFLSKETDIPRFTHTERHEVHDQKNQIPFDVDFNAFLRVVIAELSFCLHYGQKRSGETCEQGCHFTGYLCRSIKNCLSNRFPKSIRSLSSALAWLLGDQTVGLQHLEAVLPFTLAHRIAWTDPAVAESEKEFRNDPLEIQMARKAVREMLRRYREQEHRIQQALATACRIAEGEMAKPVAGDHPLFHEILKDLDHEEELDGAVCALYQKIWGLDLGADKFETIATRLSRIPYLDRSRWPDSIRRFASAIKELLEEEMDGEIENPSSMGNHEMGQYSPQEIEQGFKDLASDAATTDEFNAILKDIQDDLSDSLKKNGLDIGLGKGDGFDAEILYYMKLAQNHALTVRKRPMEKSGSLYPHHHVPWEAGQPFYDIDPWKSFGKVLPGLTKSWQRVEGEIYGREYGTPDCMVIIDSSKSMVDPRENLSHAVLGAGCAVDAYLRKGARIAVYNFSDAAAGDELTLPYTRNRRKIYKALCRYFGGGTQLCAHLRFGNHKL